MGLKMLIGHAQMHAGKCEGVKSEWNIGNESTSQHASEHGQ